LPDAFPFFRRIVVSSALRNDGKRRATELNGSTKTDGNGKTATP
jgi:hypothetical protein